MSVRLRSSRAPVALSLPVSALPDAMLSHVFSFLSFGATWAVLRRVCRLFRAIADTTASYHTVSLSHAVAMRDIHTTRLFPILARVRVLDLSDCDRLSPLSIGALALHCPLLTSLDVSHTRISDAGLQAFFQHCPRLCHLTLFDCVGISDIGLAAVRGLTQLQVGMNVQITRDAMRRMVVASPHLSVLQTDCTVDRVIFAHNPDVTPLSWLCADEHNAMVVRPLSTLVLSQVGSVFCASNSLLTPRCVMLIHACGVLDTAALSTKWLDWPVRRQRGLDFDLSPVDGFGIAP